jgi:hypothetical protein
MEEQRISAIVTVVSQLSFASQRLSLLIVSEGVPKGGIGATYVIQAHPRAFKVSVSLSRSSIVVAWSHEGQVICGWDTISRSLTVNMSHWRQNRTQAGAAKGSSNKRTSNFTAPYSERLE